MCMLRPPNDWRHLSDSKPLLLHVQVIWRLQPSVRQTVAKPSVTAYILRSQSCNVHPIHMCSIYLFAYLFIYLFTDVIKCVRQVWPSRNMALYLKVRIKNLKATTSSCSFPGCTNLIKTLNLLWSRNMRRLRQKEEQNHPIMFSLCALCATKHKN